MLPLRTSAALALSLVLTAPVAAQPPAPEPVPAPAPVSPPVRAADTGDFKVVYEKVKNPDYQQIQAIFRGTQLLEETARALNGKLALPADVTVALRECGTADAPYEPDKHRVSLCYELIDAFADLFLRDARGPEDAERAGAAVAGATVFVLFHQAGHALISLYPLAVEGSEEEAVDQLSTLILLASGKEGEGAALDGAATFLAELEEPGARARLDKLPFWSGHALTSQRFSNVVCWVYGKNPAGLQDLVDGATLPGDRAVGCPAEYERVVKAWEAPLAPYARDWAPTSPPLPPPSPVPPSPPPPTP